MPGLGAARRFALLAVLSARIARAADPELFLPVVLDVLGEGGAHYTTELTVSSRAAAATTVRFQYTASAGGGSGEASVVLLPGETRVIADAIEFLRGQGLQIPADGTRIGTLRAVFSGGAAAADVFLGGRTSTPGAGGTFGLFYTGAVTSTTTATIPGLQQGPAIRSNVAVVNAGPDPIGVRVQIQGSTALLDVAIFDLTLPGWGWTQLNQPLAGLATSGRAIVTRTSGASPFSAYGVLNDAVTSDGSFVPPLVPGDPAGADRLVPIVLRAAGYQTEVTFTNLTAEVLQFTVTYTGSPQLSVAGTGSRIFFLSPRSQRILDAMALLSLLGLPIPAEGNVGGSLLVKFDPGTPSGAIAVGARTYTTARDGGTFGLFYPGLTSGECATDRAFVNGLQQNATQRSNVAVVNRGDAGDPVALRVTYHGADGAPLPDPDAVTLSPGEWRQFNQPLASRGAAGGYATVERLSGSSRWAAYGVLNDQHNSDGSYIPMSR